MVERVRGYIRDAGRDPAAIGMEGRTSTAAGTPDEWLQRAMAWQELGATHLSAGTGGAGFTTPRQHIDAALRWKEAVDAGLGAGAGG